MLLAGTRLQEQKPAQAQDQPEPIHQSNQELEATMRRREQEEQRSTFISVISHELQTPIAIIKGYASTLARTGTMLDTESLRPRLLAIEEESDRLGLVVIACDQGPGIPDVTQALREHYSTSHGLGMGLPGVRRVMDDFAIESTPGEGTRITMKKWRTKSADAQEQSP